MDPDPCTGKAGLGGRRPVRQKINTRELPHLPTSEGAYSPGITPTSLVHAASQDALLFFFLPSAHGMRNFPGQGTSPYHSSGLSCCSDNTGSLTHRATWELPGKDFFNRMQNTSHTEKNNVFAYMKIKNFFLSKVIIKRIKK